MRVAASNRSFQDLTRPLGLVACLVFPSCSEPSYLNKDCAAPGCDAGMAVPTATEAGSPITVPDARLSDAGTTPSPSSDAASPDDAAMSPGAEALLLGNYAVRIRYHAKQPPPGLFKQSEEAYLLADVQRTGDGSLQLRTQVCEQHSVSTSSVGPEVNARISYPEYIPARSFTLVIEGGTFRTDGPAIEIGYEAEAPAGCTAGGSIAGSADQPWLTKCTCPSSSEPPTSASDCRVIDSDHDRNPGMTVRFNGLVERTDFVRRRDASQLVSGSIASDSRHTAQYQPAYENYVLNCQGSGCGVSDFVDCPPGQNRVLFAPLAERAASGFPYTCADVLREVEAGQHFPADALAFPGGC